MRYNFFRRNGAIITLAILAGIFTLAPQIILDHSMAGVYAGVHQSMNPDEEYYMARAQDVIDGHFTVANPYLFEHKDEPSLQVWIPDAILAWGSFAIFHDVHAGALAWDFILPAVLVLLTYTTLMIYTRERLLSFAATMFLSTGLYLEVFNRPVSPQFNFIFYLVFIIFFLKALLTRKRNYTVFAAISLGALFYVYTYYWTYVFVWLALVGVGAFLFFRKERLHRTVVAILGGGLVLGMPYFLAMRSASSLPYYQESLARVGMITTHSPSGIFIVASGAVVLLLMFCLWCMRILAFSPLVMVVGAGVAAGIIATNQHIITGLNLEFSSHYHLISMYADIFACVLCAQAVLKYTGSWHTVLERIGLVLIVIFSLVSAILVMHRQIVPTPDFISSQRYAPTFAWLNAHAKVDDVVYADQTLSNLIPAYTHNNVFYAGAAMLYIMPQADVRARFLAGHYLDFVLTRDMMTDGLVYERQVYGNYYIEVAAHAKSLNTLRHVFGMLPFPIERYPEADMQSLVQEWRDMHERSFMQALARYRVDYVVWDRTTHPEWHVDSIQGLHEVYKSNNISVYTP